MTDEKREKISHSVIKTLHSKFTDFPEDASNNRNAPFHKAFLNAFQNKFENKVSDIPFFISLSSWFHGLNTTLGQTFFEKVSHILSDGTKEEFKGLTISQVQQSTIIDIVTNLKNGTEKPNLTKENEIIFQNELPSNKTISNFTADCFFEESDSIVAIELKTVKPNSGIFKNEKEKILSAKAAFKNRNPNKEILFYLGFPFDPLSDTPTGSDKSRFMKYSVDFVKFFDSREILVAGELWDFLSGEENTMQQILDTINKIATPNFLEKYEFLNDHENKKKSLGKYIEYLGDWNLFSEEVLVKNDNEILRRIIGNKRATRIFNQSLFNDGAYNSNRQTILKGLL